MMLIFLAAVCAVPIEMQAQSYREGDTLKVVATSGLRLRTSPHTDAGTIRILDYGEPVRVLNTFGFDEAHSGAAGWLDGHWIHISVNRAEGYVFDAFVSALDVPTREDELCHEGLRFTAPLQTYLNQHYPVLYDEHGLEHSEDVDQCISYHKGNIEMTITQGNGWYKTDVFFEGYRLSEVVNLLRSMIVGQEMLQAFDESLTFYRNREGKINRIRGGTSEYPVQIQEKQNAVEVSLTELTAG